MKYIPLLGCKLKDEEMCELFELWDCDVIFDYDRLNENTPDSYWTAARDEGVEFRFNELSFNVMGVAA